ncbi:MAG TPA: hypothetical protein VD963_07345 [Phycisphaerales bacterium]|nr:hypothetical protein [Phycisphaerales bacterium]
MRRTPSRFVLATALLLPLGSGAALAQPVFLSGGTIVGPNDLQYEGQDIVIHSGTVTITGLHAFNSLIVHAGGTLTHAPGSTGLNLVIERNLTIHGPASGLPAGQIDVSGRGHPAQQGPGAGGSACGAAGGGGHGGRGGPPQLGGAIYGSPHMPSSLGSGGGQDVCDDSAVGGAGGGSVRLQVLQAIILNGQVDASGQDALSGGAGGGSGGSVLILAADLFGIGTVRADGGSGSGPGGAGGGGRVSLITSAASYPCGMISVHGPGLAESGTVHTRADADNNGHYGTGDISAFLAAWFAGLGNPGPLSDFNRDGVVTTADVSAFLSAWFDNLACVR